ncbi:hypothetical protein BDV95DRAFT_562699 [Massariosphaeria phaeospora]|uniref:NmrA-like domain-containing protein n=1 Tax=Massariosphaeria phaeospora TaxID=100035 RepID=A0A7C8IGI6_9PLEO|nr:hypothetical protein BDV95DRAFT_562699 [Massariosphaeria phaeospora]
MASKDLLVIFGATGNQGGSTAHIVLDDPELSQRYSVRAITRSASNPAAQALKSKGAEIVEADLDDPASLKPALKGASFVFGVTNTQYDGTSREVETRQAKALCTEAVAAGVKYFIWSSGSPAAKHSHGKLNVPHFDVKSEIEEYVRTLPFQSAFVAPGSFMQNLWSHMMPKASPSGDGTYAITNLCHGSTPMPLIDITDTGKWTSAILADPDKYAGKYFAAAQRLYTFDEMASIVSKVTGKTVRHQHVPDEVLRAWMPEAMRESLGDMQVLWRDYGYYGETMKQDVEWAAAQARGQLTDLETYLRKSDFKIEE